LIQLRCALHPPKPAAAVDHQAGLRDGFDQRRCRCTEEPVGFKTLAASFGVEYRAGVVRLSSGLRFAVRHLAGLRPDAADLRSNTTSRKYVRRGDPPARRRHAPFARSINLEVGYRHSDYSTSGSGRTATSTGLTGSRYRQRCVSAACSSAPSGQPTCPNCTTPVAPLARATFWSIRAPTARRAIR
jgi:hypothetical protein